MKTLAIFGIAMLLTACASLPADRYLDNQNPANQAVGSNTASATIDDFGKLSPLVQAWLKKQAGQAADPSQHAAFIAFVNSHPLIGRDGSRLHLNDDGTGSFLEEYRFWLNLAANTAHHQGTDLSEYGFLAQKKHKNPYEIDDLPRFITERVKMTHCARLDDCTDAPVISRLDQNDKNIWLIRDAAYYDHAVMAMIIAAKLRADGDAVSFGLLW